MSILQNMITVSDLYGFEILLNKIKYPEITCSIYFSN